MSGSRALIGGLKGLRLLNAGLTRWQSTVAANPKPAAAAPPPPKGVPMVELEIDGKKVTIEAGTVLIRACETAGVEIPRFCYHERLAIAGNCRMCLVELEKSPKPIASCAMPVAPGMKVKTNSPMVKKAREGVMEFLLVNHPLDCPICDQGGECDLQDQSMVYGSDRSRFLDNDEEGKRAVEDKNFGPLVKTVMTRCIHCTRCVRFANEVAGIEQLGTSGRGHAMEIGTYVEKMLDNELSGNIIDLCPVGALTSKPYAFNARPWELRKIESIDVHDALGSNIRVDARGHEVMRILPRVNDNVNEEWLGDKSRFAYDGLKRQRLLTPLIREGGKFVPSSWEDAFTTVREVMATTPGNKIKAIVGQFADAESIVCLKDLCNRLGSSHLHYEGEATPPPQGVDIRSNYLFNSSIKGIEESDCILLIGTNPKLEAPVLNARIRKSYLHNYTNVGLIGYPATLTVEYTHLGNSTQALDDLLTGRNTFTFAQQFRKAKKPLIIVGADALSRNDADYILNAISQLPQINPNLKSDQWNGINILHRTAARSAALELGFIPGVNANSTDSPSLIYLLGADEINPKDIPKDAFVIYQGHHGDVGATYADVILPGAAYTEKAGSYLNTEGRLQFTRPAVSPPGNAREDWKIIAALSQILGFPLPYTSLHEVRHRLTQVSPAFGMENENEVAPTSHQISTLGLAQLHAKYGKSSSPSSQSFSPVIKDYYLTDPISRASQTMARCSAAFNPNSKQPGVHNTLND